MARNQISARRNTRNGIRNGTLALLLAFSWNSGALDTIALLDPGMTRERPVSWKIVRSGKAGVASVSLFAPELSGDGQTATWRVVIGSDAGRQLWAAVGNFLAPGLGGYWSAALVAPGIVPTANHCLYAADHRKLDASGNAGKQLMNPKRFVFVAGLHDTDFVDLITESW